MTLAILVVYHTNSCISSITCLCAWRVRVGGRVLHCWCPHCALSPPSPSIPTLALCAGGYPLKLTLRMRRRDAFGLKPLGIRRLAPARLLLRDFYLWLVRDMPFRRLGQRLTHPSLRGRAQGIETRRLELPLGCDLASLTPRQLAEVEPRPFLTAQYDDLITSPDQPCPSSLERRTDWPCLCSTSLRRRFPLRAHTITTRPSVTAC